ncbi:MAG: hypothetical protein BGO29_02230 [Bacteroidales bacterium 36-12]|nr:MAG: hypothetical protein BGO29_02230 [Bacteroidales bacterium 36-12]
MNKRLFLFALSLFVFSGQIKAYDFVVNGMSFNVLSISNLTASLASIDNSVARDFIVPSTVEYAGKTLSVTTIDTRCFTPRTLSSITIPNTISTIYEAAFTDLIVDSIIFQEGTELLTIGGGYISCFVGQFDDGHVGKVFIGRDINYTNQYSSSLFGTTYLKSVEFGANVTSICKRAFSNASNLEYVILPKNLESIGDLAFSGCAILKSINLPQSVTHIGGGAFYGTGLDSLYIPEQVLVVESMLFRECSKLKKVNIPNKATQIGQYAFNNCKSLKEIVIPESVSSIGKIAFKGCDSLHSITILNPTPITITDDVFSVSSYWDGVLYVPFSSKQLYSTTVPWSNFQKIEGVTSTEVFNTKIEYITPYPNPTSSILNLDFGDIIGSRCLMIFNSLGQQVYESKINENAFKLDVSNFPNGLYFIRVRNENNIQSMARFIKN